MRLRCERRSHLVGMFLCNDSRALGLEINEWDSHQRWREEMAEAATAASSEGTG